MAAGFAVVGVTLATVVHVPNGDTSEKIIIATLGAVSSLVANFIGAIYIRMYSQTISSLGDFHTRLVGTHHLIFANFLATRVKQPEREGVLAEMAVALTQSLGADPANPQPPMASSWLPPRSSLGTTGVPSEQSESPTAHATGKSCVRGSRHSLPTHRSGLEARNGIRLSIRRVRSHQWPACS